MNNVKIPDYHLIQRKRKSGTVLYAGILEPDGSGRYSKMIKLETEPSGKGKTDTDRRNKQAYAELLELSEQGKLGMSTDLARYLDTFWDYERSDYVRSRRAEGRELAPLYCANCRAAIRDYFTPYMQYRHVNTLIDLTKQHCLQWRNHLYENRYVNIPGTEPPKHLISATTVNKVRMAVNVALNHAESIDLIPMNPMRSIRPVKEEPKQRKIFEKEELAKLFAQPWTDMRAYAGAMLAAATGLRMGEVRGLLYGNTYLDEGYLHVLTNWQNGEGLKPPKWNDKRYGIPLPGRVVSALQAVIDIRPYPLSAESFVFFGDKENVPVTSYVLRKGLETAMKTAQVPAQGRTFHCLRHTAASLIAGTAGTDRVQRLLGHTTQDMTLHYTHATDADREIVLKAQTDLW